MRGVTHHVAFRALYDFQRERNTKQSLLINLYVCSRVLYVSHYIHCLSSEVKRYERQWHS